MSNDYESSISNKLGHILYNMFDSKGYTSRDKIIYDIFHRGFELVLGLIFNITIIIGFHIGYMGLIGLDSSQSLLENIIRQLIIIEFTKNICVYAFFTSIGIGLMSSSNYLLCNKSDFVLTYDTKQTIASCALVTSLFSPILGYTITKSINDNALKSIDFIIANFQECSYLMIAFLFIVISILIKQHMKKKRKSTLF